MPKIGRMTPASDHYQRNARLVLRLANESRPAERLSDLARAEGLSPFHLQRSFRRWVGLTPKQFASFARVCRAEGLLRAAHSVLDVSLDVGLSGPGRLHDHFITVEALSPGEFKSGGRGLTLGFGMGATPLGDALIAWSDRGICRLAFLAAGDDVLERFREEWPAANLRHDDRHARKLLEQAFDRAKRAPLRLLARGTSFQIAVWRALLEIPEGDTTTYASIAARLGVPRAARAVGRAIGDNPIGYLIPCHRVIRASGLLGGYRWGLERKAALLAAEGLRISAPTWTKTEGGDP